MGATTNMIADALRERILSGCYLGNWVAGQRLPSARELAGAEDVDRKTVSAAYRRLADEGLVRIRPRSGVYLAERRATGTARPLDRLYRRWLANLYEGARALELDTAAILHLVTAIAETEARSIPVVDGDPCTAELLANELRARLHVPAIALPMAGLRAEALEAGPVVVATPGAAAVLGRTLAVPIVAATLAEEFVDGLRNATRAGGTVVFVPGEESSRRLRSALTFGQLERGDPPVRVEIWDTATAATRAMRGASSVFLWPGSPPWLRHAVGNLPCITPRWCLAESALRRVRAAILDAAIELAVDAAPDAPAAAQ